MSILSQAARAAMRSAFGGQGVANEVERTMVNPQFFGTTFYVHSGRGSDSYGGLSPKQPLATIAAAIAKCTASVGDRVFVLPGHSESISGAGAITPVAGISIVGFGAGKQRPLITLHTTTTTIAVSAANVTFRNLRIATDVDAVVKVFNITAAGCTIDMVDFEETASCACLQFVLTSAAGDDLTIQNCRWVQTQTAATALSKWIELIGADRVKIYNNYANIKGFATANPANGIIVGSTTACNDVEITHNRLISTNSTGAIPISLLANTTGFVTDNRVASAKTAVAGSIALASCFGGENYAAHTANKNGLLDPVVDT